MYYYTSASVTAQTLKVKALSAFAFLFERVTNIW